MNNWLGTGSLGYQNMMPVGWLKWMVPLMILDLVLRGYALWRSSRKGQNIWFIFLLIINSVGILPAIYLLTNKGEPSTRNQKKK